MEFSGIASVLHYTRKAGSNGIGGNSYKNDEPLATPAHVCAGMSNGLTGTRRLFCRPRLHPNLSLMRPLSPSDGSGLPPSLHFRACERLASTSVGLPSICSTSHPGAVNPKYLLSKTPAK
ncbi:UNVERIFIED_CONTAM: hypothetical protein FKN15_011957 [Acipenser sinensis]